MTTAAPTPSLFGQCLAEFLGTALLIFFGTGCVAALKVAGASFGQWEISIIWGLGVSMAIYLTAGVSGAHLNPAVTIALWLFACFDGRKAAVLHHRPGGRCVLRRSAGLRPLQQPVHRVRTGAEHRPRQPGQPGPGLGVLHLSAPGAVGRPGVPRRNGDHRHSDGGDPGADRRRQRPSARPAGPAADRPADCRDRQRHGPADRLRDEPGA